MPAKRPRRKSEVIPGPKMGGASIQGIIPGFGSTPDQRARSNTERNWNKWMNKNPRFRPRKKRL